MTDAAQISTGDDRDLTIVRTFDAPRELVFEMWTDPAHTMRWWGPRDYPAVSHEIDFRVGGKWRGCLRSLEDEKDRRWQGGEFVEIAPPERLVFTFRWDDGEADTVVTVSFRDLDGKTEMVFHQTPMPTESSRDGHVGGWNSTFDRLDDMLAAAAN